MYYNNTATPSSPDVCCSKNSANYSCQLCIRQFSRRSSLVMHYTIYHRVHGISKSSCCHDTNLCNTRTRSSQSSVRSGRCRGKSKRTASGLIAHEDSVNLKGPVDFGDVIEESIHGNVLEAAAYHSDFYLRLQDKEVKGASLTYMRRCLACVYCAYKSNTVLELSDHMQGQHPGIIKQPIEQQSQVQHNHTDVIRMSEYLQQTARIVAAPQSKPSATKKERMPVSTCRCEFCHRHFTNKTYLKRHRDKQHITPKVYQCDLCDHVETTRHKLKVHREKHLVKEFQCKQCDFVSTIKVAIQSHRQVHAVGSYICEICGRAYKLKDTLQKHKRVHDTSRPFPCTFEGCTLRFKTERMCRGHLKTHYGDTSSFPCSECGYSFRHKHHLKRHLENAHNMTLMRTDAGAAAAAAIASGGAFEIPSSSTANDANETIHDSESSSFNLRNIILAEETFQLSTTKRGGHDPSRTSIILLKPNEEGTVLYQSTDANTSQTIYKANKHDHLTPVFLAGEANETEEVITSEDLPGATPLLQNTVTASFCLEGHSDHRVDVEGASTVVEFIVDSNTDGMVISTSAEQEESADTLFN